MRREQPGFDECRIVTALGEDGDRLLGELAGLGRTHRFGKVGGLGTCDLEPELAQRIVRRPGIMDEGVGERERPGQIPRGMARPDHVDLELDRPLLRSEEVDRTVEQRHGCRRISAHEGALSRLAESPRRALRQCIALGPAEPELDAIPVRLLEVVAEDLVELDQVAAVGLEPLGEALVQLGSCRLR
jgi:hypothetical protein